MSVESQVRSNVEYIQHHMHNLQFNLRTGSFGDGGFWTLHLDTIIVSIVLGSLFFFLFHWVARKATAGTPGKFQNIIEMSVQGIEKITNDSCRLDRRFIAALGLTIFMWIFLMNFMDLIPIDLLPVVMGWFGIPYFRAVPTADATMTFGMSLSVFLLIVYYNFKSKGFKALGKEVLSKPFGWWMAPINLLQRLIEECVKPVSLSLRLFGNLFAGEIVFILVALLPWWMQYPLGLVWTMFHLLVIVIQAFIFMMLTIVYLGLAQESH